MGAITVSDKLPWKPALGVRETVAGHRLGALEGGGGYLSCFPMHLWAWASAWALGRGMAKVMNTDVRRGTGKGKCSPMPVPECLCLWHPHAHLCRVPNSTGTCLSVPAPVPVPLPVPLPVPTAADVEPPPLLCLSQGPVPSPCIIHIHMSVPCPKHPSLTHAHGHGALPAGSAFAATDCRIQRAIRENRLWTTRIGLHTDRVLVGTMGCQARVSYTTLGDGVNVASRLEQLCKYFSCQTLASEQVLCSLAVQRFGTPRGHAATAGMRVPNTVEGGRGGGGTRINTTVTKTRDHDSRGH